MRKYILFASVLAVIVMLSSCGGKSPDITGTWEYVEGDSPKVTMVFRPDGTGERSRTRGTGNEPFEYTVDYDKDPIELTLKTMEGGETIGHGVEIPAIIRFVDENTMRVQMPDMDSDKMVRPDDFAATESPGAFIMYRAEE